MADYTLNWIINADRAIAAARQLRAEIAALEKDCERVGPKVRGMFAGASTPVGAMSRSVNALTGNLKGLDAQAQQTGTSVQAIAGHFRATGTQANSTTRHTKSLTQSLAGLATAGGGVALVHGAVKALADGLKEARDYARETAQENIKLRDSLRELRGMKGPDSSMEKVTEEVIGLMRKSGATSKEAIDFGTLFDSTVPAARDKKDAQGTPMWQLTPKMEQEFKEKALALSVAKGVPPEKFAEVVGSLGMHQPIKTVDDAMAQTAMLMDMAGEKGVGHIGDLFKVSRKLAPSFVRADGGGAVVNDAELMGHIAASTTVNGSAALSASSLSQVFRESNKEAGEKIGIKPTDNMTARLKAFKGLMDRGKAAGRSELQALRDAGFNAPAANMAIIREVSALDLHEKWSADAAKGGDPRAVEAELARFKAENPARFSAVEEFAARQHQGTKNYELETLRQYAEAGGTNRGALNNTAGFTAANIADMADPRRWVGAVDPFRDRVKDAIISRKILGVVPNAAKRFPDLNDNIMKPRVSSERMREILNSLAPEERKSLEHEMEVYSQTDNMARPNPAGAGGDKPGPQADAAAPGGVLQLAAAGIDAKGGPAFRDAAFIHARDDGKARMKDTAFRFDRDVQAGPAIVPAIGPGPQAMGGEELAPLLKDLREAIDRQTDTLSRQLAADNGFGPPPPNVGPRRA